MITHITNIDDINLYQRLKIELDENRLILFAGSGLSAQAITDDGRHPPLWKNLLTNMIEWCICRQLLPSDYAEQINLLINMGFLIEAGQEIQEKLEETQLHLCLGEVILNNEAKSSKAHNLVAKLPFRAYLTTNYDEFIEGEFRAQRGVALPKFYEKTISSVSNFYNLAKPFILKLHGDINDPSSIILGNRSYERLLYFDVTYRSLIETIFNTSSVLFLGFSGNDPDLEGIITRVAVLNGREKKHWMLMPEDSFPPLKAERMWKDKGINVIVYTSDKEHSGIIKFLENLASPPGIKPLVPKDIDLIKTKERSQRIDVIQTTL